jgi:RNA polymerase sigma-70 factor (ECF subfamily)
LIDGDIGFAVRFGGELRIVVTLEFAGDRIALLSAVADPERIAQLELSQLDA